MPLVFTVLAVDDDRELLLRFLSEHFESLALPMMTARGGKWPSLRFDLGGGAPTTQGEARITQAVSRATAIFEAAFLPEDTGFCSFTRWRESDDPIFLSLLPSDRHPTRTEGEDFYEQGEPDSPHVTYTAALRPRSMDYRLLFRLVAGAELGESPSLDGRAYFINASGPLIFHMYDDRGAVVLAAQDETLVDLRATFSDWLIA